MAKISKEKWKVYGNVFDEFTIKVIQKLMSQKIIEGIESPVKIGKEANVFTAHTATGEKRIVKIYRLESCNFNQMYSYIKSDPRFMDIKKQRRQVIFTWVKREFKNLTLMRKAGVRAPTPITHLFHVLVLEHIGDEEVAPQLKDYVPEDIEAYYEDLILNLRLMYKKAGIVHADLSEFNILTHNDLPVIIDVSQGTHIKDMSARGYLKRDLGNLKRFFKKYGFKVDIDEAYKAITSD